MKNEEKNKSEIMENFPFEQQSIHNNLLCAQRVNKKKKK